MAKRPDTAGQTVISIDGKRICGTRRANGEPCKMPAGAGTDHKGFGKCRRHGGTSPALEKSAAKEQVAEEIKAQITLFGRLPDQVNVSPAEALLEEVTRSAILVRQIEDIIGSWENEDQNATHRAVTTLGENGYKRAVWVSWFDDQRIHLARVCKMALDAGVAERQVRLAEDQGRLMVFVLRKVFEAPSLGLTPVQRAQAPTLLAEALRELGTAS